MLVVTALLAPAAHASGAFTRGFADDIWSSGTSASGSLWVKRTASTGAKRALSTLVWSQVEPTAPAGGTNPTSPAGAQFDWAPTDALVRRLAAGGIAPVLLVSFAPGWAEGKGGPAAFENAGAWEPNPTALGQFAQALARRYSGSYPDPLHHGRHLPRVRYFQAWGEANFSYYLAPQWTKSGGGWVPTGPSLYRNMLNAFYKGVKAVHSNNTVITSGFGPYGDPAGGCTNQVSGNGCRMPPAMFTRDLLCLNGEQLTPEACPDPAHFDALAIDPYEVGSPTTHAVNRDDVSAPDLGKLTRPLNKALRLGRALPHGHKQLWVTEFSYDSRPPNPTAVSLATQARWLEESFYIFWRQGVDAAFWFLVRDNAGHNYNVSYYSGVYFYNGKKKPSFEAYRFPFVVMPSGGTATVWGISPRTGTVSVEHQVGSTWTTLFTIRDSAGGVFTRSVPLGLGGNFRAQVGGETSLVWTR